MVVILEKTLTKNINGVETWLRDNFDDRVKEGFPMKNGHLIVKLEKDRRIDNYDKAKSVNTMPSRFGS